MPAPTETGILERGIALLRELLPTHWQVRQEPDARDAEGIADVVLDITSPQGTIRAVVDVRRSFAPRDVSQAARQARLLRRLAGGVPLLVMAPWLSDRSRRLLTEGGIGYIDLTGNARLTSDYPAILIQRESNVPAPARPRSAPSLRGVKAGRVVRLLVDVRPPYGVLDLAKHAGVTPGYMSRLLGAMASDGLVERTRRGSVSVVSWRELLERRTESYGVFTSNSVRRYVCPNGPAYALEVAREVSELEPRMTLTGSFAAERIVAVAPPALLVLYTRPGPSLLVEQARLLPAEAGANVVIATPYDAVAMESRWPEPPPSPPPRLPLAAASQIALDCLTGNGRMPQEGEALLDWMGENEPAWRLPRLDDIPVPAAC